MSRQSRETVHKCHSDPGQANARQQSSSPQRTGPGNLVALGGEDRRPSRGSSAGLQVRLATGLTTTSQVTRKRVLTLDGYSYIIGELTSFSIERSES